MVNLNKNSIKKDHLERGILLYIVTSLTILGFYLRYSNIEGASLWMDELYTLMRIKGPIVYTLITILDSPFPPLYYLLMNIFTSIFGTSDLALRFPSVIFSTLTIPAIYFLGKELFNWKTGIIASSLFTIYPYAINYAQEAKQYSLLWLLMILSFLFLYRFIEKRRKLDKILYIICISASIYTLYIGFIFIIIHWLIILGLYRDRIKEWIKINLWIILLYLPWIFIAVKNWVTRSGIKWIPEKHFSSFIFKLFSIISNQTSALGNKSEIEVYIYLFFILLGIILLLFKSERKNTFLIMTLWITAPPIIYLIISLVFTPLLVHRYASFIFIPLMLFFSYGCSKALERRYLRFVAILFIIILFFTIINNHILPIKDNSLKISKENWKEVFEIACNNSNEKTLTIIQLTQHVSNLNNSIFGEHYGSCIKGSMIYQERLKPLPSLEEEYSRIIFLYRGYPSDQKEVIEGIALLRYNQTEKIHSSHSNIVIFEKINSH